MGAHFRAFLHHTYGDFLLLLLRQLHDATRGRQSCWTGTDDHNIKFHRFTFH